MKRCVKIKISGKVQGVSYRHIAQKCAEKLGVEGTAQNLDDHSVLIQACGESSNLDEFIDLLYKGSPQSKVEEIAVEPLIQEKSVFRGVFRVIDV